MSVPSNLIPTRITQLPIAPVASEDSILIIVYQGNTYQIRAGDLLSVAGVPVTRQVIAGTGLTGGGQLLNNVTLSVASKGIDGSLMSDTGVTPGIYGNSTNVPVFTVDSTGRVTAATTVPATVSGYVPESRQVIAGTGLTGGGALNTNVTLNANLSNNVPLDNNNSGAAGVSTAIARADHQHPAVDLSDDDEVDGILGLSNGGTARSLTMNPGAIIWSGADGLYVGPPGVYGQVLISGGSSAPLWASIATDAPQPAHYVYIGPTSAPNASPTFRLLVSDDLPSLISGKSITTAAITNSSIDSSPIGASSAAAVTGTTITANTQFTGPGTGLTGTAAALSIGGNAATATSAVTATNVAGGGANRIVFNTGAGATSFVTAPTVANTFLEWSGSAFQWSTNPLGTVTSVGLALPSEFNITNSPVTTSGTLTGAWTSQTANYFLAAPNGSSGTPSFRAMAVADVPTLNQNTTGQAGSVANAVTFTNTGGASPGATFDGSAARTIDYSTVGAPKADGTGASGTWNIDISGNAATATSATTATNLAGGAAGSIPYQTGAGATTFLTASSGVLVGGSTPSYSTAPSLTGTNFSSIPNGALQNSSFTVGSTSISLGGSAAALAGLTSVTVTQPPSAALQLATKQYVDDQVATGIDVHSPVRVETPAALNATYTPGGTSVTVTDIAGGTTLTFSTSPSLSVNDQIVFSSTSNGIVAGTAYYVYSVPASNQVTLSLSYNGPEITTLTNGTGLSIGGLVNAGVGATLTNAGANAAIQIDGITLSATNRVLVYNQVNAYENGVYTVTTVGTPDPGGTPWVLTRSTDTDRYRPDSTAGLGQGDYFFVQEGNTGAGESYILTTNNPLIIGTTNLTFTQFSASQVYSAGTGLTLSGTQFSLTAPVVTTLGGTGLSSYTTGDLLYYSTGTALSKLGIGTATYLLTSSGSAPQWSDPTGVTVGNATNAVNATNATNATSATTATNVAGGAAGSLLYQTGASTTTSLALGASSYLLTAGGSAPQWSDPATVTVGSATTATNANNVAVTASTTNATFYPTFVDTTTGNQAIEVGAGLTFNPSTNVLTTTTFSGALSGNATTATTSTNVAGGSANQIVFNTGAGTTSFITAPTVANTYLEWSGSAFQWSTNPLGTVTSVGLALPSEFTISNSPVTTSGTLTGAWANQTANYVLAGPTTGPSATPTFRALVNDDVPNTLTGKTYNGLTLAANATGFQIAGGTSSKTMVFTNSITLSGTDSTTITLPATTGTVALDNQQFYIGTTQVAINRASASLSLTGVNIDGSAGSATNATNSANIAITDDTTTNATMYPVWVTANTGNLPAKVTSSKLSFNPSTGVLTATGGISGGTF